MKFKHTFRKVEASESVEEYCQDRFEKIGRHLLKDSHWQVSYSKGKFDYRVEVSVSNPDCHFKAQATADSFYEAIDGVAQKLSKQFLRTKEKLQHHKKFQLSKQAKIERLNTLLEFDTSPYPVKKSA